MARDNGRTLRRLGVTMVMAPVADVDPDGRSVMGSRTYSPDRDVAARMVTATVKGYLEAGVIPAVKHFPGLGTVTGDSHHALPEQGKSLAQLRRTDLVTFAAAVEAGAPGDHDRRTSRWTPSSRGCRRRSARASCRACCATRSASRGSR